MFNKSVVLVDDINVSYTVAIVKTVIVWFLVLTLPRSSSLSTHQ